MCVAVCVCKQQRRVSDVCAMRIFVVYVCVCLCGTTAVSHWRKITFVRLRHGDKHSGKQFQFERSPRCVVVAVSAINSWELWNDDGTGMLSADDIGLCSTSF